MASLTAPAVAQFGSIFSDEPPPRPPGNVPRGNQQQMPPADLGRGGDAPQRRRCTPAGFRRPAAGAALAGADELAAVEPAGCRHDPIATPGAAAWRPDRTDRRGAIVPVAAAWRTAGAHHADRAPAARDVAGPIPRRSRATKW